MSSEVKKLNVDGAVVKQPDDAQDTYKSIPEADTEYKPVANSNMVKENVDNCVDGADEKMLSEEEKKLTPKGDMADVKFVIADQQNGDAKIDIMVIKQGFTGLTKEELLKFSNDPFWVRIRWFMFISFWLLWLGMLAGAIVIIMGAPSCSPPPPKTWWQEGPLIDSNPASSDSSTPMDYKSYIEKLPLLSKLKIKGVIVPATPGEDDYSAVIPTPTDVAEFKKLAELAKEKNIHLIVDLTPNYVSKSSEWFIKSEKGEEPYRDYFIWTDKNNNDEKLLPNNWLSVDSETPAWSYSKIRQQFYLHQFNESTPDLNFRNKYVIDEFTKVIQFWVENGATGVRISKVKYLLVDQGFNNETFSPSGSGNKRAMVHSEYGFYTHTMTTYQAGLVDILSQWKDALLNSTQGKGMLMLKDMIDKSPESLSSNGSIVVDLPRASRLLPYTYSQGYTAPGLHNSIQSVFSLLGEHSWPSWTYTPEDGNFASELGIVTMLLPGVPILTLDQIITADDNKTEGYEQYSNLATMRSQPSMMYGGYNSYLLANQTVFAFSRLKSGNPGLMVLFNPSASLATVNLQTIQEVPREVRVSLLSDNYDVPGVTVNGNLLSSNVTVSAKSIIIVTYVPVKKE